MSDIRIINAYAQALFSIGEKGKIDVAAQLTTFQDTIRSNDQLETLIYLDVFTMDEKKDVITSVLEKLKLETCINNFVLFLLQARRFDLFPQIFAKVISIDDDRRGFIKGKIESAESTIPKEVIEKLSQFLKNKIGKEVKLSSVENSNLTAGYRVTVGDLQLDASLENQLEQFKTNILNAE